MITNTQLYRRDIFLCEISLTIVRGLFCELSREFVDQTGQALSRKRARLAASASTVRSNGNAGCSSASQAECFAVSRRVGAVCANVWVDRQHVDEKADQPFEFGPVAPCYVSYYQKIGLARQFVQKQLEAGEQYGERRHAVGARERYVTEWLEACA